MKFVSRMFTGASTVALFHVMAMGSASAQTAAEEAAAQDSGSDAIIVTAQRRDQRLQDVPISMAVIGGAELENNAISNITELAPRIPNFSITRSPAANAVTMRGVGASTGSPSLEQSVVIFVDGIYGGNNRQFGAAFMDVGRIEVLRGPQGALVGKNTVAGAINIITRRPSNEFGGYVTADYDFLLDGPTIEGGLDIPLGGGFAARVVGRYSDLEGYIHNELTDRDEPTQREWVGRVSLGYDNGGPVTAFLKYERSESDGLGNGNQIWAPSKPGYELDFKKFARTSDRPETNTFDTNNLVAQFDFDLDWATLTSITGYSGFKYREHLDSDWTPLEGAISDFDMDLDQFSQELRLVSATDSNFDYAAGALVQVSDLYELRTSIVLQTQSASNVRWMDQKTKDISAYAQAGYNFGQLRLQGSLRYSNVRKEANYKRLTGPLAQQYSGIQVRNFDAELENNLWDPSVVLQYRPNNDMMFYASFQMGSKSGGFQGAIANAEEFSFVIFPERSRSFEAGAKIGFAGGSYFNLAAFHTTYDDLQISTAISSPDGLSSPFFTGNAGSARAIGVEVDGLIRFSRAFEISVNGAWNPEAKFTSFRSGPCPTGRIPDGDRPGSCNLTGLRLPYTPRLQATVSAQYRQELTDSLRLTLGGSAFYRGLARQAVDEDDFNIQDEHVKLDARIAIGAIDDSWEIGVVGRNLTDILTKQNVGSGGLTRSVLGAPDAHGVTVAPPRQILVTASVKF